MGASWGLLGSSLGLSWSPFGAPDASRTSKSKAKSPFDANMTCQLPFGAPKITSQLAFGAPKITSQLAFGAPASPLGTTNQPLRYDQVNS